jgi:pilus assembly protein Flp/PilA
MPMRLPFLKRLGYFLRSSSGATAIEYGLIAAGISVAISTVVFTLGNSVNSTLFSGILNQLNSPG